jgi:hypothetical protein
MQKIEEIERLLSIAEHELAELDVKRQAILDRIDHLKEKKEAVYRRALDRSCFFDNKSVTNQSSQEAKIHLFRSLFRGREDVYPLRYESQRTGTTGYQPACRNEWVKGLCGKLASMGTSLSTNVITSRPEASRSLPGSVRRNM